MAWIMINLEGLSLQFTKKYELISLSLFYFILFADFKRFIKIWFYDGLLKMILYQFTLLLF